MAVVDGLVVLLVYHKTQSGRLSASADILLAA